MEETGRLLSFSAVHGLKELKMRFETVERLKQYLYVVVEGILNWEFTTGDGVQMVADRSSLVESSCTGFSEDHDYYCMCIYFILAIYAVKSNEHNQDDLNSKAIREKVEERVREIMDNAESANYVVVSLVLKPGPVDKGQITSAQSLSKACP